MADRFTSTPEKLTDQASSALAVTPSDSVDLANAPKALYIGVTGDITMRLANDTASV